MPLDITRTRQLLKDFNYRKLFIEELGWDRYTYNFPLALDGLEYSFEGVAEKRGMAAFVCRPKDGDFPDYTTRRKLENQLAKCIREHIIIYTDGTASQIWQWVRRETGRPVACREHRLDTTQSGEALAQKLQSITFEFQEETNLSLVEVSRRSRAAFDVERVTKRFYERFKTEHAVFLKFIKGIPDEEMHRWYASVMLNRLMFIYFVQKKGFLDQNPDYLQTRLAQSKRQGKERYYAQFLCPLFFEGFAKEATQRAPESRQLLGDVPYLNGGLFLKHQIEEEFGPNIRIADEAFEKVFGFFEQYHWHLDERPLRADNEVNPDVLGYIFEKYINQKQMGAYYTKEDITEYISKNTVVPFLFDQARKKCRIAFEGEQSVWRLIRENPDRYIYDAVRCGVIDDAGNVVPESSLPDFVQRGMKDPQARMFARQYNLGTATTSCALPTETWREYVERRMRCLELRQKMADGYVKDINNFITFNLDIRQFAQDVIESSEGPELLRAFWQAITSITILDPTCGSGAFLFAALNILEPLYEACLDHMAVFLDEMAYSGEKHSPKKFSDFREILDRVAQHPNRRYFILKSIMVNNLYGVDIMEEATEICKLRLFLKLIAQVESVVHVEPLPDIDFNIRAGNTLVGFTSAEDVRKYMTAFQGGQLKLLDEDELQSFVRFNERVEIADRAFQRFHEMQTEQHMDSGQFHDTKQDLRSRLDDIADELNQYLAQEYCVEVGKRREYEKWLSSHQPFHWFSEFFGIMQKGGFDVVIGNPPYVEYAKVKNEYSIRSYSTEKCGNLYVYVIERAAKLVGSMSRSGLIVPMSLTASRRMRELREQLRQSLSVLHVSSYAGDAHPSVIFEGVRLRLSIIICSHVLTSQPSSLFTTIFQRWYAVERPVLFSRITMCRTTPVPLWDVVPKLGGSRAIETWERLLNAGGLPLVSHLGSGTHVFYQEAAQYFVKVSHRLPYFAKNGIEGAPPHGRFIICSDIQAHALVAVMSSTLFYWWYHAMSDCYHVSDAIVQAFPCPQSVLLDTRLGELGRQLEDELHQEAKIVTISTGTGDSIAYAAFNCQASKPILDKIDRILANHYGFTDEELDFIVNYDIKYRMGRDSGDEDAE